jgi:50S ribosomal protein L16 3-hydroxylase
MAEAWEDETLYRDPKQAATNQPGAIPEALVDFSVDGLQRLLADRQSLACALGEVMTEPKPRVWFEEPTQPWSVGAVVLDRRTRMMHDPHHIFINGESFLAGGADARLMRELADRRNLSFQRVSKASTDAQALMAQWFEAGWLHHSN